jgi:hypothetical protein
VQPRGDVRRGEARGLLSARLNKLAPGLAAGPAELEPLGVFVRGTGAEDSGGSWYSSLSDCCSPCPSAVREQVPRAERAYMAAGEDGRTR